jgi:hypothetical protein
VLSVRERPSPWRRCPICHDDVATPSCLCSGCRAEFHEDCRLALGRCSTLSCFGTVDRGIRARENAEWPALRGLWETLATSVSPLRLGALAMVLFVVFQQTAFYVTTHKDEPCSTCALETLPAEVGAGRSIRSSTRARAGDSQAELRLLIPTGK